MTELFLQGLALGFSIAAPVGPIGVLCIRRTLADGRAAGFVSGLGAASADAIYGSIAAFGLTIISGVLVEQKIWLGLFGGAFLCYLGVRTWLAKPASHAGLASGQGLLGAYVSTLLLTLTNPMTILSFAVIFAGLVRDDKNFLSAVMLVLGVFAGSTAWWFALSGGVSLLRGRFDLRAMQWINRIAGMIILGFGLLVLFNLR
jgi:threonine/homoserine/homoserine lactone efflux protein